MKGIAAFRPVNHLKVIIFNPFLTDIIFKHFFRSMLGELVPAVSLMGYLRLVFEAPRGTSETVRADKSAPRLSVRPCQRRPPRLREGRGKSSFISLRVNQSQAQMKGN